jgi:Dolichyl-phosphate-mannose-protein mannosyltransferase
LPAVSLFSPRMRNPEVDDGSEDRRAGPRRIWPSRRAAPDPTTDAGLAGLGLIGPRTEPAPEPAGSGTAASGAAEPETAEPPWPDAPWAEPPPWSEAAWAGSLSRATLPAAWPPAARPPAPPPAPRPPAPRLPADPSPAPRSPAAGPAARQHPAEVPTDPSLPAGSPARPAPPVPAAPTAPKPTPADSSPAPRVPPARLPASQMPTMLFRTMPASPPKPAADPPPVAEPPASPDPDRTARPAGAANANAQSPARKAPADQPPASKAPVAKLPPTPAPAPAPPPIARPAAARPTANQVPTMQFRTSPPPAAQRPPANPPPANPPTTDNRVADIPVADNPPAAKPPAVPAPRPPVNQVPTMQFRTSPPPAAQPRAAQPSPSAATAANPAAAPPPAPDAKPPVNQPPAAKPPAADAPAAERQRAQTQPALVPPGSKPPGSKPPADQPPAGAPTAAKPSEAKPSDTQPSDAQPSDAQPSDAQPPDAQTPEARTPEAKPPAGQPPATKAPDAKSPAAVPPPRGGSGGSKRSSKKGSRSVFGPAAGERPDVLTDAETVVMAVLGTRARKPSRGSSDADPMRAIQVTLTIPAVITGQDLDDTGQDDGTPTDSAVVEVTHPQPVAKSATGTAADADPYLTLAVNDADIAAARAAGWTKPGTRPAGSDETTQFPALMWDAEGAIAAGQRSPAQAAPAGEPYVPSRRRTLVSRLVLLAVLGLQAILSLRLSNTAFKDEALYLYAGHMELVHLLHGTVLPGRYATFFPGSPVLYPLVAGAFSELGGLNAARALSLVEMLAVTALLYSLTRRLFNERAALCAALIFSASESAIFLGHYATFDASSLFLLAVAAWILVRTAGSRWPLFLLAAPVAALAVAVEYSAVLFLPTLMLLPALAGWPALGRRVLLYSLGFGAVVSGLLAGALRLGGPAYRTAISLTTTSRAPGTASVRTLLLHGAEWGGVLFALALFGTVAYVWNARTEPDEDIARPGGRVRRVLLGIVLTGTALLVPAYAVYLHANASFPEHIGFGLFFAAPMAGLGVARGLGDHFRRPHFPVAVWCLALVLGMLQSAQFFKDWPTSSRFVSAFATYLQPGARYLVEVPQVPVYYLSNRSDAQPSQFSSTAGISFTVTQKKAKKVETGPAAFTAAVKAGYYQVIAFNDSVNPANDTTLTNALQNSKTYYLARAITADDGTGEVTYQIWVKGKAPDLAVGGSKGTASRKVRS